MQTIISSQPKDVVSNTRTHTHKSYRRGASAARKAHNLEVTGSTPVAGIITICSF